MNVAIFEGPKHAILRGWRHYQIRLSTGRVNSFVSEPHRVPAMVKQLRAEFFEAGTWEDGEPADVDQRFPLPRADILAKFSGSMRPDYMGCAG